MRVQETCKKGCYNRDTLEERHLGHRNDGDGGCIIQGR